MKKTALGNLCARALVKAHAMMCCCCCYYRLSKKDKWPTAAGKNRKLHVYSQYVFSPHAFLLGFLLPEKTSPLSLYFLFRIPLPFKIAYSFTCTKLLYTQLLTRTCTFMVPDCTSISRELFAVSTLLAYLAA